MRREYNSRGTNVRAERRVHPALRCSSGVVLFVRSCTPDASCGKRRPVRRALCCSSGVLLRTPRAGRGALFVGRCPVHPALRCSSGVVLRTPRAGRGALFVGRCAVRPALPCSSGVLLRTPRAGRGALFVERCAVHPALCCSSGVLLRTPRAGRGAAGPRGVCAELTPRPAFARNARTLRCNRGPTRINSGATRAGPADFTLYPPTEIDHEERNLPTMRLDQRLHEA